MLALAIAIVLGTIVFVLGTLSRSGDAVDPVTSPPVSVPAASPAESATPSETEPPEGMLPPANPHASEGLFLSSAYAKGGKSVTVTGERYLEMVGASTDASIVAVNSDYELRGINAASSAAVWTYPSYSCSKGTWDGVALCADTDDPETASNGGPVPDIVGIDLATGKALFRFTPENMPGHMNFIGADDAHGYFRVSLLGVAGHEVFGKAHVLALDRDGSVAWMAPLEAEGVVLGAALVSDNQISINLEKSVVVLDRASGAITADVMTGDDLVILCWDGWSAYLFDERRNMIYDLKGVLVDEYTSINEFIPDFQSADGLSVPAYERGALDGSESFEPTWGVTRDGTRAVADDAFGVIAPNQEYLVEGSGLAAVSGDGGLFLSDLGLGTVHDSRDGTALASFPPLEGDVDPALVDLGIVDGIVVQNFSLFENDRVTVMLPGE